MRRTPRLPQISALVALSLGGCAGCDRPVDDVLEIASAIERKDLAAIAPKIHSAYSDPIGGRAELMADLGELFHASGRISVRLSELSPVPSGEGVEVIGTMEVEVDGTPSWRVLGPARFELVRDGRLRFRAGILDDLRSIRRLFADRRAAMEANDADAYAALLHPHYRDGDVDLDRTIERLRGDLAGLPIRLEPLSYWVELRGLDAHVDERYRLRAGDIAQTAVGRFTLRRSAGVWRVLAGLYPTRDFE